MYGWTKRMKKQYDNTLKERRKQFKELNYEQMLSFFNRFSAAMKLMEEKISREKNKGNSYLVDKYGSSKFAYNYWLLSQTIRDLEDEMPYHKPVKVGMYFNATLYTDTNPYKIVWVSPSGKRAKVRRIECEMHPNEKGKYSQNWLYGEEIGEEIEVRLGKHGWKSSKLTPRYLAPSDKPYKYYDFEY